MKEKIEKQMHIKEMLDDQRAQNEKLKESYVKMKQFPKPPLYSAGGKI